MSVYNFQQGMMAGAAGAAGGYTIDQSIRFDSVRNSDLTRTLPGDGNLKTGTFSFWMKRSGLGSLQEIFTTYNGSVRSSFFFQSNDTVSMQLYNGAGNTTLTTTAVFRDPGAFAHYLFRWDTTQATDTDRLQFYYNGVLQTVTGTYPALNSTTTFSDATHPHIISGDGSANTLYEMDGYLAEIHYVDGTALAATDFGEYNADGVWVPKAYAGTYGTNGFYITGADSADLGADESGNGNDFTSSGLTSADQMLDTPTDNFCTLNAVDKATQVVLADGNLQYGLSTNNYTAVRGTFGLSSGKWYWEMSTVSGMGLNTCYVGIATNASDLQVSNAPTNGTTYTYMSYTGNKTYTSQTSYGDTWNTNGRVIGVALDLDAGKIWWSRDGVWQASGDPAAGTNEAFSGITGTWHPYVVFNDTSPNLLFNFGQSAFTYTPPTGFNALSTANLPTPSITDGSAHFQPTLYTGTGSSLAVTQSGNSTFQPDWVWIKGRSGATEHVLTDAVRGVTKELSTNDSGTEETVAQGLTTFGSAGFTVGTDGSYNTSSATYVGWQWKANGAGSSNTDGSINTTATSVNTTAGFSISKYDGSGSNATVGHGLGIAPKMVIVKELTNIRSWVVYHEGIGDAAKVIYLDQTAAAGTDSAVWNSTAPTSTVFSVGTANGSNGSGNTYIAYCFAEIPGYSSFGSYIGNGSTDGPFVYCGFLPAFVMVKAVSTANSWNIVDTERDTYNPVSAQLAANGADAEASGVAMDLLSSGFKIRDTSAGFNTNTNSYIYMAFAESPFKYANAR